MNGLGEYSDGFGVPMGSRGWKGTPGRYGSDCDAVGGKGADSGWSGEGSVRGGCVDQADTGWLLGEGVFLKGAEKAEGYRRESHAAQVKKAQQLRSVMAKRE